MGLKHAQLHSFCKKLGYVELVTASRTLASGALYYAQWQGGTADRYVRWYVTRSNRAKVFRYGDRRGLSYSGMELNRNEIAAIKTLDDVMALLSPPKKVVTVQGAKNWMLVITTVLKSSGAAVLTVRLRPANATPVATITVAAQGDVAAVRGMIAAGDAGPLCDWLAERDSLAGQVLTAIREAHAASE